MTEIILQEVASLTPFTIIVLDDFHCINDEKIHEAMGFLLQNLPAPITSDSGYTQGCHFVILTRTEPDFPLARWRLHDELTEIRALDLRFR